jgi:hypothetical protein
MNKLFPLVFILLISQTAFAKIWRVNNTPAVNANFTSLSAAVADVLVLSGDTIHVEPSAIIYTGVTITKNLVIIGNGYLLTGTGSNAGLQENTLTSMVSSFTFGSGSAGTRIIGIDVTSIPLLFSSGYSGNVNLTFEKCRLNSNMFFTAGSTYSNISFRKCLFVAGLNVSSTATVNNFTVENCILNANVFYLNTNSAGIGNVFRNNAFKTSSDVQLTAFYVANNLFLCGSNSTFINCNVKNNIFSFNQTGVTVGPLNVNGNNLVFQSEATLIVNTASVDGRFQLAGGSPAIGGGVDISGTKPDCGAFGGNDPYKLSGIPGIPTLYSLTVPSSIPLASPTMNVTFSTRNNN